MNRQDKKRLARSGKPLIKLHVLGAAGGVTGSLNLIEYTEKGAVTRFLLDAGLTVENESADFKNRLPSGLQPQDIDFIIISHAHIDHSGLLPKLVKDGFKGRAYVTEATRQLLEIMLPDSGYLQEENARRSNNRAVKLKTAVAAAGTAATKAQKASAARSKTTQQPLYTKQDATNALDYLSVLPYDERVELSPGVAVTMTDAGHLLGSAVVNLEISSGGEKRRFCFTGNLGRPDMPILKSAARLMPADYLMTEATYGNKSHKKRDRLEVLAGIINSAYERAKAKNGVILIPAFAVGRAQTVLFDLRQLMTSGRVPRMPVFVDGPMANRSTAVHRKHPELFNDKTAKLMEAGIDPFQTPRYTEVIDRVDSEALDKPMSEPTIIVGSSGMAAGGRIVRHLMQRLSHPENTVLFVGYQGTGTLGSALVGCHIDPTAACATEVKIYGTAVQVKAKLEFMSDYSGHADGDDLIALMGKLERNPKMTFIVHGTPASLDGLKEKIETRLNWKAVVPKPKETFIL